MAHQGSRVGASDAREPSRSIDEAQWLGLQPGKQIPPRTLVGRNQHLKTANWIIKYFRMMGHGHLNVTHVESRPWLRVGEPLPDVFCMPSFVHNQKNKKEGTFDLEGQEVLVFLHDIWFYFAQSTVGNLQDIAARHGTPDDFIVTHNGVRDSFCKSSFIYTIVVCWTRLSTKTIGVRAGSAGKANTINVIDDYFDAVPGKVQGKGIMARQKVIYTAGSLSKGPAGKPPQQQNEVMLVGIPAQSRDEEAGAKAERLKRLRASISNPGAFLSYEGLEGISVMRAYIKLHIYKYIYIYTPVDIKARQPGWRQTNFHMFFGAPFREIHTLSKNAPTEICQKYI